ncbi:regulatory protein, luxR family [Moheibacter sediminis]|uniref:Regulatory protein, luxR family n=2 Tax=Moheibacter sediminis TaxID=1434700 RepID=A0A1W2C5Y2_9FLAO|nr:regulatory protein, luxR family [Moheibacter sediminis]
MMMKPKLWIFFCAFLIASSSFAQINDFNNQKTLDEKLKENNDLLMTAPDQAFIRIDELIEQALKEDNKEAELTLLSKKAWYYVRKTDLKKAIKAAKELDEKAIEYDNYYWQSAAHSHLLEIYSFSGLPNQAIEEFHKSNQLLEKSDQTDDKMNYPKAINHIKIANVYEGQGDFGTAKKMLIKVDEYISKVKDNEQRKKIRYYNFTNLGAVNLELNMLDSAAYFIEKSLLLSDGKNDEVSLNQFRNLLILGQIYNRKKDYLTALKSLKQAEKLEPRLAANLHEKNLLYEELVESYEALDSAQQANLYLHKAKDITIELERNKSSSLNKIIDDNLLKEKSYTIHIALGAGVLLLVMSFFLINSIRKNKLLATQEKAEELYLDQNKPSILEEQQVYTQLIEMAKNDDKSFIIAFHDKFPDFYKKLIQINSKLVESEIEFCALLKLKLSTKEIAQIQNIEPKTVKNKKNRIRKRLNISAEQELYYFFNQI